MAAYAAILNGLNRFVAAAFAPVLLNIVMIAFMAPLVVGAAEIPRRNGDLDRHRHHRRRHRAAGHGLWRHPPRRLRATSAPGRRFDREVRRFWVLAIPAVISGGITQINIFVGTIIASGAASAIAYLVLCRPAVPAAARHHRHRHRHGAAARTGAAPQGRAATSRPTPAQNQALLISMLLSMPAATALIALAEPIVRVLFQRGAFTPVATVETAHTLIWFSAGLPAYVLIRVLQPGFFAREDTVTPTIFAGDFRRHQHRPVAAAVPEPAACRHRHRHLARGLGQCGAARHLAAPARPPFAAGRRVAPARSDHRRGTGHGAGALWPRHAAAAGFRRGMPPIAAQIGALGLLVVAGLVVYFGLVHVSGAQPMGLLLRRLERGA